MTTIPASNKTISLFPAAESPAPLFILNTFEGEGAQVCQAARRLTRRDFSLAAVAGIDWNGELSPWPAPPVFRGAPPFTGGADAYLEALTGAILPAIVSALPAPPTRLILAGYSLAGLFALYSLYRTDAFDGVVSASGSLWYPGFLEYAQKTALRRKARAVYLSLGDREARTRSPAMRSVQANTEAMAEHLRALDIPIRFELNPGGHFEDPAGRVARGMAWMIESNAL